MTVYRGLRLGTGLVLVSVDDGQAALVPDANDPRFDWGSSGSGTFALARTILTAHLGARPSRGVAHTFACETVATWKTDRWLLTSTEIDQTLIRVRAALALTCLLCGDTGRREIAAGLWRGCECRLPPPPEA